MYLSEAWFMARVKINLTMDEASRIERNRLWRETNRTAIEAYEREVIDEGLALTRFRSF